MADLDFNDIVQKAMVSCLSSGFNAAIAANALRYGVAPFELDFSDTSTNFVQDYIDPEAIELSSLLEFPGMSVYTEEAAESGDTYALGFSGAVIGCIDCYIRQRDGAEGVSKEAAVNRIIAAVFGLFRYSAWPKVPNVSTVTYSRRAKAQKRHYIPLGDGWGSRISIQAQFSVSIN